MFLQSLTYCTQSQAPRNKSVRCLASCQLRWQPGSRVVPQLHQPEAATVLVWNNGSVLSGLCEVSAQDRNCLQNGTSSEYIYHSISRRAVLTNTLFAWQILRQTKSNQIKFNDGKVFRGNWKALKNHFFVQLVQKLNYDKANILIKTQNGAESTMWNSRLNVTVYRCFNNTEQFHTMSSRCYIWASRYTVSQKPFYFF